MHIYLKDMYLFWGQWKEVICKHHPMYLVDIPIHLSNGICFKEVRTSVGLF
jgi:hypothetical protein